MKKQLITLAIAAAFAAPALAQSPGRTTTDPKDSNPASGASAGGFAAIDRNGDGYISRDEARDATWNSRFTELDKDNDGRLSADEFSALIAKEDTELSRLMQTIGLKKQPSSRLSQPSPPS